MHILEEIIEVKKEEVKKLRTGYSYTRFADSEYFEKPKLSLENAINNFPSISIIAEIKKTSPSKGIINKNFDHLKIADEYFKNSVDAVSILSDKNFFKGDIKFIRDVSRIKAVPLLRKDFIIDEYQIFEAKSNGADAVLLIAEILSKDQIIELTNAAAETDLEILLEIHSEEQLSKINFELNKIIGINNRNLQNFSVDIDTTLTLSEKLPESNLIVSESGINSSEVIDLIKDKGIVSAVLVGEHFMKSDNLSDAVCEMKKWCSDAS